MFQKDDRVKVILATDETLDPEWIGKIGKVIAFNTNGETGNTETDPLVAVLFDDGTDNVFWNEELELVKGER